MAVSLIEVMAGVVNDNPGYDGLKKKAVFVAHEDTLYTGFVWTQEDKDIMAINHQWHKDRKKLPDNDIRAYSDYMLSLPPTLANWLFEQPEYENGTAKERKTFIDKLCANDACWAACKRI